ncbi:MAG: hypothetical protein JXQ93_11205 [Flavobacteriaceae bacterium]
MNKTFITLFFSVIFFSSVITPTLLTMAEDSYGISLIEDIGTEDEEEKNNKESSSDLESKIFYPLESRSLILITKKTKALAFYNKVYSSISKKRFSPPPEHA